MAYSPGSSVDSKPAVYNEKSTGANAGDLGLISALRSRLDGASSWDQLLAGGQVSDSKNNAANHSSPLASDTPLRVGRVLLALPYVHCYKVQLTGRQGTCIATSASNHSRTPLGVRSGEVIAPNSNVLIWNPASSELAYILAVLPSPVLHDDFNASDHIQQGGNSGPKKVDAYRNIPRTAARGHGWVSQSCGRPMDGTIGEYVRMSETGIGLLIDSFQTYLRVNETCGLWLNYFDNYTKLAGLSLNIMSYCTHNIQQYDEGENFSLIGHATYPWEAAGMYAPLEKFTKTNSAEAVQMDRLFPFGLEEVQDQSQTPLYRLTDYTGYLGQGFNRTLIKPAKDSGKRLMTDAAKDKDIGLFQELIALDGSYSVRSAKQIMLAKYPLIPNPRRKRLTEDTQGEDLTERPNRGQYKFSGKFGGGPNHVVLDWKDDSVAVLKNILRPAGIMDLLTHHYNWKSTHPFFYHKKDYDYPEEGDNKSPLTEIRFYRGEMSKAYVEVTPQKLLIDERYKDVNYYNTAAFITIAEDGSIVIADGYGSQLLMGGGQIRLEAGGDVMLMSGARVVTLANEAIIRARGSVDISSNEYDVRIKAERNMQLLAGNSGAGGMLLESKGKGVAQVYQGLIGEEVRATGITLLSRGGSVNTMSKTAYIRTGVDEGNPESTGDLIIDCANGRSSMVSYARSFDFFCTGGVGIWHSPSGQGATQMTASHYFGAGFAKVHGPAVIEGHVGIVNGGSLTAAGGIYSLRDIQSVGGMACKGGYPKVGDSSKSNLSEILSKSIAQFTKSARDHIKDGNPIFLGFYSNFYWKPSQPGNSNLLGNQIGFSYRDTSIRGNAYGYSATGFFLLETRWQQLERMGMLASAGRTWTEKVVKYQGKELYPWPGKINWVTKKVFLGYSDENKFKLFETKKARSRKDNTKKYEEPSFPQWKERVCDGNYSM
jgi:hypothetical protein